MEQDSLSNSNSQCSPHLTPSQIQQRLVELDAASGQRRIDLMTELAWRPAWAIRSRRGVGALLKQWWTASRCRKS